MFLLPTLVLRSTASYCLCKATPGWNLVRRSVGLVCASDAVAPSVALLFYQ